MNKGAKQYYFLLVKTIKKWVVKQSPVPANAGSGGKLHDFSH